MCILCFTRSDVRVVVDVLVPDVNGSNGVFIAARVDQGGCQTFLARGVFVFLLFGGGHGQVVIATDLGQSSYVCLVAAAASSVSRRGINLHFSDKGR